MKKLLLIPLLFVLSGCYTILTPSAGIRSNVEPGVEVYFDWYGPYPSLYFNPYLYYPRWNRVIYNSHYDFNIYYTRYWNKRPVVHTVKTRHDDWKGKDRGRNTVTRNTDRRGNTNSVRPRGNTSTPPTRSVDRTRPQQTRTGTTTTTRTRTTERSTASRPTTRSTPRPETRSTSTRPVTKPTTTRSTERSKSTSTEKRTTRKRNS